MAASATIATGEPRRRRVGGLRVEQYAPVDDALLDALPGWCERGTVDDGEPLGRGNAFRLGGLVIKHSPPPGTLRTPRALRAARIARRIGPERTPPVLLAAVGPGGRSLLIASWIAGRTLGEAWNDADARADLPALLAHLHRRRVFHGDLHSRNALWTGERLVAIDLDGVRHPLHGVLRRRQVRRQWAVLHAFLRCPAEMPALFARYAELLPLRVDVEREWARIERWGRAVRARIDARAARGGG